MQIEIRADKAILEGYVNTVERKSKPLRTRIGQFVEKITKGTFKTAMSGVQLVYELATPITYHLTPTAIATQDGINNIWADTGDVISGEYMEAL